MKVADIFAATIRSSQATMEKLAASMAYVAPIARALNISLEDTSAALGILYNRGIQASVAGTGLRMSLTKLASITTDLQRDTLRKLGLTVADISPQFNSLAEIIDVLSKSGAGLVEISQLVGVRAATVLLNLIIAGREEFDKMRVKVRESGQAVKQANITLDTMSASFKKLWIAIKNTAIALGEKLAPYVRSITDEITKLTDKLRGWLEKGGLDNFIDVIFEKIKEMAAYLATFLPAVINSIKPIVKILIWVDILLINLIKRLIELGKRLEKIVVVLATVMGAIVGFKVGGPFGALIGALAALKLSTNVMFDLTRGFKEVNEEVDSVFASVDKLFNAMQGGALAVQKAIESLGKVIKKDLKDSFLTPKEASEIFTILHHGTAILSGEIAKLPPWMAPPGITKGRGRISAAEGAKTWETGALAGKAYMGSKLTPGGRLTVGEAAWGAKGEAAEIYAKEIEHEANRARIGRERLEKLQKKNITEEYKQLKKKYLTGEIGTAEFKKQKKLLEGINKNYQMGLKLHADRFAAMQTEANMINESVKYYKKFVPLGFHQLRALEDQAKWLEIAGTPAQIAAHDMRTERAKAAVATVATREERLRTAITARADKARITRMTFLEDRRVKLQKTLERQTKAGMIQPSTQQALAAVEKELEVLMPKDDKQKKDDSKIFKNQLTALQGIHDLLESRLIMGLE